MEQAHHVGYHKYVSPGAPTHSDKIIAVNPLPADNDHCRFKPVLLVDKITEIGNEKSV